MQLNSQDAVLKLKFDDHIGSVLAKLRAESDQKRRRKGFRGNRVKVSLAAASNILLAKVCWLFLHVIYANDSMIILIMILLCLPPHPYLTSSLVSKGGTSCRPKAG